MKNTKPMTIEDKIEQLKAYIYANSKGNVKPGELDDFTQDAIIDAAIGLSFVLGYETGLNFHVEEEGE